MTDAERAVEILSASKMLMDTMKENQSWAVARLMKWREYPAFARLPVVDDRHNRYLIIYYLTKKMKRKRQMFINCVLPYEIPPNRKEQSNCGKGFYFFNPCAICAKCDEYFLTGEYTGSRTLPIYDFTPHALSRYKERYLAKVGGLDLSFEKKIENILGRLTFIDAFSNEDGDKNAAKHINNDTQFSLDIMMRGGGMFRGRNECNVMTRMMTYVSPEMMFENQLERFEKIEKTYYKLRTLKQINF